MENWLRNNIDSMGFTFLKEELQEVIKVNSELLINDGLVKQIYWQQDSIHLINDEEIVIPEEDLCDFWIHIRNLGIIKIDSLPERFINYAPIMLDILKRLNYVQPIMIVNNDSESTETSNGYQYIST